MSLALLYWIILLVAAIFSTWSSWPAAGNYRPFGSTLFLFVLLVIIGWKIFGPPIHS